MKRLILLIFLISSFNLSAQEVISAKELLQKISDTYKANVKDLEADIEWQQAGNTQKGKLYFRNPQQMRIDFSEPAGQVICSDGYELQIYVPALNVVLMQTLLSKNKETNDDGELVISDNPLLLNPVGYDFFLKNFSIAYNEAKTKVVYDDGTEVYKFKLIRWRSAQNGFNVVYLTVQENGVIREVVGITAAYKRITMKYDNVKINQNISRTAFEYEPPSHTNKVENFIVKQGE